MLEDSKVDSAKKLTAKTQLARITVSVLMASAFARKVGLVKIVQLKTKLQFPAFQLALITESLTCTLKNASANQSTVVTIVPWSFVT